MPARGSRVVANAAMDIPPNQTVYVNNLYEKLPKEGKDVKGWQSYGQPGLPARDHARLHLAELKKCLYSMFSQFGKILDVVCLKTYRLRGQAWIVFADVAAATNAMRTMQGFVFFEKPLVSPPRWTLAVCHL